MNERTFQTVFENGSFRPLQHIELTEGSEVELELVRIVRRWEDESRTLLEGDEVELRLLRVTREGPPPGTGPAASASRR